MNGSTPGAFRQGSSPIHRLRPGAKLAGLFTLGLVVVLVHNWLVALGALILSLVLAVIAGLRWRELWRLLRGFALVGVLLFAFQVWQHDLATGFTVVAGLYALIVTASAVTASTSVEEMLDTVIWLLQPFRRCGVQPERVALAFSLTIRSLPLAYELAAETRAAAKARGLERSPRALLIPFVLRMIAHARATGEALHARGLDD